MTLDATSHWALATAENSTCSPRIDSSHTATHQVPVSKLLRHLLCLWLLLGLVGNGVAVAAPCIFMPQSQPAAMADMPDCDMARPNKQSHHNEKGKAPGCMAAIACAATLAIKEPGASTTPHGRANFLNFWPTPAKLAGRDVAPEPEPPTLLG